MQGGVDFIVSIGLDPNAHRAAMIALAVGLLALSILQSLWIRADISSLRKDFLDLPKRGRPPIRPESIRRKRDEAVAFASRARLLLTLSVVHFVLAALVVPSLVVAAAIHEYQWLKLGDAALAIADSCTTRRVVVTPSASHVLAFLANQVPEEFRVTSLPLISELIPEALRNVTHNAASWPIGIITLAYKVWVAAFALEGVGNFFPKLILTYIGRSKRVRELDEALDVVEGRQGSSPTA